MAGWMMRVVLAGTLTCGLVFSVGTTAASATLLDFSFDNGLTFTLDSDPTPYNSAPDGSGFAVLDTSGDPLVFTDPGAQNGLAFQTIFPSQGYDGALLYSNGATNPHFETTASPIELAYADIFGNPTGGTTLLTISNAAAPGAPAPALGLGLLPAIAAALGLGAARLRTFRRKPLVLRAG